MNRKFPFTKSDTIRFSKSLHKVSSSYTWTPKEVAGRADRPIYLLLLADLKNEVKISYISKCIRLFICMCFHFRVKKVVSCLGMKAPV